MKIISKRTVSLLMGIIFVLGWLLLNKCSEAKEYEDTVGVLRQSVKTWKDKEGNARASIQSAEADIKVLKEVFHDELATKGKEIDGLKRNLSNLQNQTNIVIHTTDTLTLTVRDTIVKVGDPEVQLFNYEDEWATINGTIDIPNLTLTYAIRDSISLTHFYKRQGLFKPRLLTVEAITYNPNTTITGIRSLTVKQKKPKLVIGFSVGVTYIGKFRPYIGVGVTYPLLSF